MADKTNQKSSSETLRPDTAVARLKNTLPDWPAQLAFWLPAVVGLALDLWSKKAVFDHLRGNAKIEILDGILCFVTNENPGAAFGIAAGQKYLLVGVSLAALVTIFAIFLLGNIKERLTQLALGPFAGGISGNLYDRIFNDGAVRDFIDVAYWPGRRWPTFNAADTMLCVAVALMLISGFFTGRRPPEHAQQQTEVH